MARVSEIEVKEIIDTDLTAEQISPFLTAANLLITDVLSGEGYSTDLLKEIEKWLAAHFVAVRDPQAIKEKIGDAEITYSGKFDEGLKSTRYGQQVLILDHQKRFAEVNSTKGSAQIKVIT